MSDADWPTSVHEAAHAVFALQSGWAVRSVDVEEARTVIAEPTEPEWWQRLALAAQCLAGEYAAWAAVGMDYPFPDLLGGACTCDEGEDESWRCDECRARQHLHAAIPNPMAPVFSDAYRLVQHQVRQGVESWWDEIIDLARRLRVRRRFVEGDADLTRVNYPRR